MTNDQISTALGIELLKGYADEKVDMLKVLCKLKGAEKPEQLTRAEIAELTTLQTVFVQSTVNPKNVEEVNLSFRIKVAEGTYQVELGKFLELDITLRALDLVEDFNPQDFDRIPVTIGCIYSSIVKNMLRLSSSEAHVAAAIADAVREQVPFEDSYALYDFFVMWKAIYLPSSPLSKKVLIRNYRLRRRIQRPTRLLLSKSLAASPRSSKRTTSAFKNLRFIASMLKAQMIRWFWLTIASLRR